MSSKLKNDFIKSVTKQIRFPFDRKIIAIELQDHLLELEAFYFETSHDRELAKASAILEMGDPKEIGKALNQVHKPFWGWLWFLSKTGCILLSCIVAWMSLQAVWDATDRSRHLYWATNPADEYYLRSLGDNPNQIQLIASYGTPDWRIYLHQDIIQFDDVRLYSDGTLILFYQDMKPFNPFGIGSDDYLLQQCSFLILPDGSRLGFRPNWPDIPNIAHVLVATSFPLNLDTFELRFEGYSDLFQTVIRLRKRYEKK
jgi:hypothetical protein